VDRTFQGQQALKAGIILQFLQVSGTPMRHEGNLHLGYVLWEGIRVKSDDRWPLHVATSPRKKWFTWSGTT
jgi:hypothetical protein